MMEFLTLKPKAFGLDISDFSLKIVSLEKKKRILKLENFFQKELTPGIVEEGEIKDEEKLAQILREVIKKANIKTKYVIASLPERKVFLEIIQMPKLTEEELKSAIIYEIENYIPLPVEKIYLDYQVVPPIYESLEKLEVLIVAFPKEIVDSYFRTLKSADLFPLAFESESLAIARSLVRDEITDSPILLIDLGATKTTFIIFSGYSVRFSFSSPLASKVFTEAISKNLKISFTEAERLKIKCGLEEKITLKIKNHERILISERGEIFEALIPPLVDLTQQIKKCIDYYQTHISNHSLSFTQKKISKILLCGGGANLKGLCEFLSLELKTPVFLGNPWVNIFPEFKEKERDLPLDESLKYTTALGLALRGIKE